MTTEQASDQCVGMPTTDEHKLFEPFVGTFKATVKMWMGPGDPMVSTGVMTNTLIFGGRYLEQDYKGDPGPGPFPDFRGRGYWGYNTADNRFDGVWLDSVCTFPQIEHGEVDGSGKVWTMLGAMTNPETGKPMKKKTIITLRDKNSHDMVTHFDTGDGKWVKSMEITYKRA